MTISPRLQGMLDRAKKAGITEIVLQHNDFMVLWEHAPDARRGVMRREGEVYLVLQDVKFRSSWNLPKTDPLWEGHTRYDPQSPEVVQMRAHWPWIVKAAHPTERQASRG